MAWYRGRRSRSSEIVVRIVGTKVDSNRTSIVDAMYCDYILPHSPFGPQCHTTNQTTCRVTVQEKPQNFMCVASLPPRTRRLVRRSTVEFSTESRERRQS